MKTYAFRMKRGQDLLLTIEEFCREKNIEAGVMLSGVGCVTRARLRDAGGVTIRNIDEPMEIVSLNGTVSKERCHLHAAFSKEDLSTAGGHLVEGCIVNTTCEAVIGVLNDIRFGTEFDEETGYEELVIEESAED